jgi:hypothetical protein
LGIIKCFKLVYKKLLVLKAVSSANNTFHSGSLATDHMVVSFELFYQCSSQPELNTWADLEEDDAFHKDRMQSATDVNFSSNVYSQLATCGVSSIDKLCDDYECGRSSGEKEEVDKCDPELV